MVRLPDPGGDDGAWGDLLNAFLLVEHDHDGSLRADGSLAKKYELPVGGIPKNDLNPTIRAALTNAETFTNTLAGLSDVSTSAVQDAQVLSYHEHSGTWRPITPITSGQMQSMAAEYVHLTSDETISGIKTFVVAPIVPAGSFPETAITGLQTDLAARMLKTGDTMTGTLTLNPGTGNSGLIVKTQFGSSAVTIDLNGNTIAYQKLSVGGVTSTSTHTVNGSFGFGSARSVGSATTLTATDAVIFANSAGGGFTVTLPSYSGLGIRMYVIKKVDSTTNPVTIATTSSQPIDVNQTSLVLNNQNDYAVLLSDNVSGWKVIGSSVTPTSKRAVTLVDAATITPKCTTTDVAIVTLGGNRTIANPSGVATSGQELLFRIKQDATGSRTVTWDTKYRFSTDIPRPTLSTTASKTDYIRFTYNSEDDKWDCMRVVRGF